MFGTISNPDFLFIIIALLVSIVLHEFAHAATAVVLGDPTPRLQGRLTLNPLAHFEPIGLILILIAPIGWARPVVSNTSNFKHPRLGLALVALAGPAMNLLLACLSFALLRAILPDSSSRFLISLCFYGGIVNVNLCLFNLIPIPPLDGSRILALCLPKMTPRWYRWLEAYGSLVILVVVVALNGIVLAPLFAAAQSWVESWFQLHVT